MVWACIANKCLGADNIPRNLSQCWEWWCEAWLRQGRKCPMWGVAAICWAIWKARNKVCFDKKLINSKLQIEQTLVTQRLLQYNVSLFYLGAVYFGESTKPLLQFISERTLNPTHLGAVYFGAFISSSVYH